jgi:hypothetical protein
MANADGRTENIDEDLMMAPGKFESWPNLTLPPDVFSVRDRTHRLASIVIREIPELGRMEDGLDLVQVPLEVLFRGSAKRQPLHPAKACWLPQRRGRLNPD